MVQLFCLSAHRTLLSTPRLPSSLYPSFALTRELLSVTRPKLPPVTKPPPLPPRSPPQKSCIWQPLWPRTSTAGLFSFPPPHQPLPPSAPRTHSRQRYTLIRLLSARCSRGISTKGSKTFWHLCLQLSLFVLCLIYLSATSLL